MHNTHIMDVHIPIHIYIYIYIHIHIHVYIHTHTNRWYTYVYVHLRIIIDLVSGRMAYAPIFGLRAAILCLYSSSDMFKVFHSRSYFLGPVDLWISGYIYMYMCSSIHTGSLLESLGARSSASDLPE